MSVTESVTEHHAASCTHHDDGQLAPEHASQIPIPQCCRIRSEVTWREPCAAQDLTKRVRAWESRSTTSWRRKSALLGFGSWSRAVVLKIVTQPGDDGGLATSCVH
jgi:hypothetical protein